MFYSNVILKTLIFFIFLCILNDVQSQTRLEVGEKINGPANIRDTVNGKILFSLNDGVIIETSPAINKWVKIGVYVKLTNKQIEAFKLEKNISLINEKGEVIGKTMNIVEISMVEDEIGYLEAYTHQDNLNMAFNPELDLMKILAQGIFQKKAFESYMKKFGFEAYEEDHTLKYKQYFMYESIAVDLSPLDRITLLFNQNNFVGIFHTRNITSKGFKTFTLVRGHKLTVLETMSNQDVKYLKDKRNTYYNSVD